MDTSSLVFDYFGWFLCRVAWKGYLIFVGMNARERELPGLANSRGVA